MKRNLNWGPNGHPEFMFRYDMTFEEHMFLTSRDVRELCLAKEAMCLMVVYYRVSRTDKEPVLNIEYYFKSEECAITADWETAWQYVRAKEGMPSSFYKRRSYYLRDKGVWMFRLSFEHQWAKWGRRLGYVVRQKIQGRLRSLGEEKLEDELE